MVFIGIDPGVTAGAMAFLDGNQAWAIRLPTTKVGKNNLLDASRIADVLLDYNPDHVFVMVERMMGFSRDTASTSFSIGDSFGCLRAILSVLCLPYDFCAPQSWQKAVGVVGPETKKSAQAVVERLFPTVNLIPDGCRKPHDGFIDAYLIAEYARRKHSGETGLG